MNSFLRRRPRRTSPLNLSMLLPDSAPRWLTGALAEILEPALGISALNELHWQSTKASTTAPAICQKALDVLGTEFSVRFVPAGGQHDRAMDVLRRLEGPVVYVSNHPFGGVEALGMMILLEKIGRHPWKVMANEMLKIFPEIADVLLYVDPFGEEESLRKNLQSMRRCLGFLRNGGTLAIFPAGSVSSFQWKKGKIADDPWMPNVAKLIQATKATVVPLSFSGYNSWLFQAVSLVSKKARLSLLVHEFARKSPAHLSVTVGEPIPFSEVPGGLTLGDLANFYYEKTYDLQKKQD